MSSTKSSKKKKKDKGEKGGGELETKVKSWLANFATTETGEDLVVNLVKFDETEREIIVGMKFLNEEDIEPHEFQVGHSGERWEFSTEDDALMDWLIAVISEQDNCKTLEDMLEKATHVYYNMDGDDEDDDEMGAMDDDDMFGEPQAPVRVAPKTKKKDAPLVSAIDFFTGGGTKGATDRLIKDLQEICEEDTEVFGFTVEPIEDNLYKWDARLFGFEGDLAKDMKKMKVKDLQLEISFPKDYPFSPPFVRVVKPRMAFHTGHVTIGGSICMEVLCTSGWRPVNAISSLLIQIRAEIMAGGARLDSKNQTPYTEYEAKAAFDRVARQHGWM